MANPTIKDVAREAGVSIATVSRVLNKKGTVKEASVQSVLQAIEHLGYHPNSIARTLKNDSSKTIGLVVTDISNDFFTRMARGIEDVLNDRGYNLFVCSTDGLQQREAQCLSLLREKQVDGIILNASGKNSSLITKMSSQVPFALFSRKIPDPQFRGDFVDNDNYSGLRELTAQLLRLGHRKIGFINGQSYVSSAAERFSGFQSAMRDAGIDVGTDYPYLYSGNFNRLNSGKEGARVLWEKGVTAILCGNNLLALGALQYCKEAGLRLPEDLSLCSFGTLANQDLLFVRPTSCEQNPDAMGARLAELIIERIESKNQIPNREIRFTTTILPGNGVGVPREQ